MWDFRSKPHAQFLPLLVEKQPDGRPGNDVLHERPPPVPVENSRMVKAKCSVAVGVRQVLGGFQTAHEYEGGSIGPVLDNDVVRITGIRGLEITS